MAISFLQAAFLASTRLPRCARNGNSGEVGTHEGRAGWTKLRRGNLPAVVFPSYWRTNLSMPDPSARPT